MTGQSLKLEKCMTDQVVNMPGHVRWPSVISTPYQWLLSGVFVVQFD